MGAQAAEQAVSDKVDWLKQNLAAVGETPKAPARKISLSEMPARTNGKKLRPFMPGRPLPRERDMQAQRARYDNSLMAAQNAGLVAQQPMMGQVDGPLTAQISAYSMPLSQPVVRRPVSPRLPAAPRAVPGHIPTLPGQVAASPLSPGAQRIPEPPPPPPPVTVYAPSTVPQPIRPQAVPQNLQAERIVKHAGALLVQAPVLTPDQRAMVEQLIELNRPGNNANAFIDIQNGQQVVIPQDTSSLDVPVEVPQQRMHAESTAGPPPFPLNLLPEATLKDFVGRKRAAVSAPPAYFGSWHQSGHSRNLPYAGFASHMGSRQILATHFSQRSPVVKKPIQRGASKKYRQAAIAPMPTVATYGPYEGHGRVSMF